MSINNVRSIPSGLVMKMMQIMQMILRHMRLTNLYGDRLNDSEQYRYSSLLF